MWKIYGTTQGLAIETNLAQLKAAFATATEVYIDPVRYADPSDEIDSETSFIRLKRKSFEYEKEVRVIVVALGPETGMYIQINVAALIQAVHLHPDSPEWLRETVEHVSQRYGHHFPVRVSELNKLG